MPLVTVAPCTAVLYLSSYLANLSESISSGSQAQYLQTLRRTYLVFFSCWNIWNVSHWQRSERFLIAIKIPLRSRYRGASTYTASVRGKTDSSRIVTVSEVEPELLSHDSFTLSLSLKLSLRHCVKPIFTKSAKKSPGSV